MPWQTAMAEERADGVAKTMVALRSISGQFE
jgi:hypothetical protein